MAAAAGSVGALCATSFLVRPPTYRATALLAGTIGTLGTACYLVFTPGLGHP
mgnify:CR=1 FL=1